MREILLRGKKVTDGEWTYGYYIQVEDFLDDKRHDLIFEIDSVAYPDNEIVGSNEISPETLGQYTGLTDKNDTKIFEGDIVKVDDDFDTFGKMAGEIREVWFKDGGFRLKPKYASSIARGDRGYWLEDGADYEVIGNIYDNPELLGGDRNERD